MGLRDWASPPRVSGSPRWDPGPRSAGPGFLFVTSCGAAPGSPNQTGSPLLSILRPEPPTTERLREGNGSLWDTLRRRPFSTPNSLCLCPAQLALHREPCDTVKAPPCPPRAPAGPIPGATPSSWPWLLWLPLEREAAGSPGGSGGEMLVPREEELEALG